MDPVRAILITDGNTETDEETVLAAWQYLHDTGLGYQLGGHFAKTIKEMIGSGQITDNRVKH